MDDLATILNSGVIIFLAFWLGSVTRRLNRSEERVDLNSRDIGVILDNLNQRLIAIEDKPKGKRTMWSDKHGRDDSADASS